MFSGWPRWTKTLGLLWLKRADAGRYGAFVANAADMVEVIQGCAHVMKQDGKLVFVLADNRKNGKVIPTVDLLVEVLELHGFTEVQTRRRRIMQGQRRYSFGFNGVMKTESVITARKTLMLR
jgi:hypothetical protein